MPRIALLLTSLALVSAFAGSISEAHACSPVPPPPPPGTFAIYLLQQESAAPKNGGVVFFVTRTPEITEESLLAETKIRVSSGDAEIPGTLRRIGSLGTLGSKWIWLPADQLFSPGVVHISITSTAQASSLREPVEADVTVEDRILTPPKVAPNIELRRALVPDETAPKIVCRWEGDSAACESGPQEKLVASRVLGVPNLVYLVPEIAQRDAPFLEQEVELFGRNTDRSKGPSEITPLYGVGSSWNFDRVYAEYCAKLTTRLLADGSTSEEEVCVPHGAFALSVDAQDTRSELEYALAGCETTVYPPGMGADDPPRTEAHGASEPGSAASCAVDGRRPGADAAGTSLVILLGGVVALVRRRREHS